MSRVDVECTDKTTCTQRCDICDAWCILFALFVEVQCRSSSVCHFSMLTHALHHANTRFHRFQQCCHVCVYVMMRWTCMRMMDALFLACVCAREDHRVLHALLCVEDDVHAVCCMSSLSLALPLPIMSNVTPVLADASTYAYMHMIYASSTSRHDTHHVPRANIYRSRHSITSHHISLHRIASQRIRSRRPTRNMDRRHVVPCDVVLCLVSCASVYARSG